jgi:hypothetical protein
MKKVVTSHEVAHLFNGQHQTEATTQTRNFYFIGKSIYSYGSHFCIAKFVDFNTLLFTERGYSNTTAKHIRITASATSNRDKIYCPYPDRDHESNFNYWVKDAELIAKNLLKARKPSKYISELNSVQYRAERYANYFGIEIPARLLNVLSVTSKDEYVQHAENVAEFNKQEERRKAREQAKAHAKQLKDWRAFKVSNIYGRIDFDYLRVTDTDFETSQRVKIPVNIGLRLYKTIRTLKPGDAFLSYQVKDITDTYIQIGCHKIAFKEIDNAVSKVTELV